MENNKKEESRGLSFIRLAPFLSKSFKEHLIENEDDVMKFFNLTSREAVYTFVAVMRDDLRRDKAKAKPLKKSLISRIFQ